ncbi:dimethylarginine dimethylaminohydrolase family protein [Heyndrickxia oleronia]|uniref:Arginine deiminase family protein n=1 Tax=Heyndrickxia oleronia TaxID=38875 RepID=A0AAW6T5Y4_9BACI|nr:arginine deiminase family protein [Heyndrickxia oleronia]MDH5164437.1 arginine deiminase family protein [Heyndrickxia oleronia]
MAKSILKNITPVSFDEYGLLKKVIMCEPTFLSVPKRKKSIEQINVEKAVRQHKEFMKALNYYGVKVHLLNADPHHPEQVFTRDIGFVVGNTFFITEMKKETRQKEESFLKNWLKEMNIPYSDLSQDKIEGGDVIIDSRFVYIGISERTTRQSMRHLKHLLPNFKIMSVPFRDKFLHLDCIFNIIAPNEAIIYQGEMTEDKEEFFSSKYNLIKVVREEQNRLGTNVFSIGSKIVFSIPENKNLNRQLRDRGYEVIELDFSEMINAGGSFRCCTLPLEREYVNNKS